jgi:hypothetical protein
VLATFAYGVPLPFPVSGHLSIVGSRLEGSLWTTSEPTTPDMATSDLSITTAGGAGCGFVRNAVANATIDFDNLTAAGAAPTPTWNAYVGPITELTNIVDSSISPLTRWVPQLVNGQRLFPGQILSIVASGAPAGSQLVANAQVQESG